MKRILTLIFIAMTIFSFNANAQNAPEQDCANALSVCQPVYVQPNSYVGVGDSEELDATNQDCLSSGENNTVWYTINASSTGTFEFTITPNNLGDDYDWAVWDVTGGGCDIVANTPPIRCNYSGTSGLTGTSPTAVNPSENAGGPPFSTVINALAGNTYILVVDNFSSSQSGYTLDFSNSSAAIYDTFPPRFTAANTKCDLESDTLFVKMSEPIKCNSISGNGSDYYITPQVAGINPHLAFSSKCITGSFTNDFTIVFSGIIPAGTYWLHAQKGTDTNSVLDNCGNELNYNDSIQFVVNPSALNIVQLDTPACIEARIVLSRSVKCNTIAADGSDFTISGPSPVEVISAIPFNCDPVNDLTNTIDIRFDTSILEPGTYTLSVGNGSDGNPITDTCGAAISNTISWDVSDQGLEAFASPSLLCNPGYTNFYSNTNFTPSAEGYQYLWSPGTFLNDSTVGTTLGYVGQSTTYKLQIKDANYCFRRDTAFVSVPIRYPVFEPVHDTEVCVNEVTPFFASGGEQYFWYPSNGLSCTDCPNPTANPHTTTQYFVVITDKYNCNDTLSQTLNVYPLPVINMSNDTSIFYGETVQLYANVNNPSVYAWTPTGSLDFPNTVNPRATPQETTTYKVLVIDHNDCENIDSVTVIVRTDIPVGIPTAFTPNGDGKNDIFHLINPKFQRLQEFRVFNRWGKEVFSTTNEKQGWDGNYRGVPQDAGVYNYVIRVTFPDGRVEKQTGNVMLVR